MALGAEVEAAGRYRDAALAQSYPISIIIPAHNAAGLLERALEAVAANDLEQVEILVVDDASSDGTAEVVSHFAAAHPGVEVECLRLEERSGPAAARNAGAQRARHSHLFFLDSDVILPPRTLHCLRDSLDLYSHRPEVAGVLGSYSAAIPWEDFWSQFKNLSVCFLYHRTETLSPYLHTPLFCVRAGVLKEAGGFDPAWATAEDFRLGVLLGTQGYRFVIDRRIEGVHWKRYTLSGILAEDWRRIRDLSRIRLKGKERRFALGAHRWRRIFSLMLPWPAVLAALAGHPLAGTLLAGLFFLLNLPFFRYCRRERGAAFALRAALFSFLEMGWAGLALLAAWLTGQRGRAEATPSRS